LPKTRLISPGSIPNHRLLKNLRLDGNYISNDGGDEGISITDSGNVGIGNHANVVPNHRLDIFNENVQLDGGATGYANGGVFITTAGDITEAMVGGRLIFDDGTDMGRIKQSGNTSIAFVENTATVGAADDLKAFKVYYAPVTVSIGSTSSILSAGTGLVVGNTTITNDEIDFKATGDFTVDAMGDIVLSADGGNVTMNDGSTTIFDFNVDEPQLKIQDDADTGDYFSIAVGSVGATTITTVDDGGAAAHLALNPDGNLTASPAGSVSLTPGNNNFFFDTNDGPLIGSFRYDANNLLILTVGSTGTSTFTTSGSGTTDSDFKISADGDIALEPASGKDVKITANNGLTFDADFSEKIESDDTDLTISSGADINLTATADVNIPADIGLTLGSDNEKIEGDGTNLALNAAGRITAVTGSHIILNSSTYTNITQTKDSATASTGDMGIRADYTRTGDISSGTNSFDHLKLTTTQTGASGGTHTITGINNIITGDSGGTVTAYGLKQAFTTTPGGALPDTIIGINSEHAGGTHMKLLYNATNYSTFTVSSSGDLNIETVGSGTTDSDIVLDADGDVLLDPAGKVGVTADKNMWFGDAGEYIVGDGLDLKIVSSRYLTLDIAGNIFFDSALGVYEFMDDGDTDDKFKITVAGGTGATTLETESPDTDGIIQIKADGDTIELEAESHIICANPIQMNEVASAVGDNAGYGQIWVKNSTPNELYFTTDAGDDIQLTSGTSAAGGGGGTSRWAHSWGGYKTNNGSSTIYYMQYYPNNNNWNNSESSPTTINYFDMYAAEWIAPANGTLTKIDVFVRGGTDDCQFYVFKGAPSETGSSSISLTQIGASGACGIDSASQTFHQTAAISSSNTFSAGEGLWIMIKKEAHSSNQSFYFSGTISGEYS
jgi:hypothetical protein